MLFKQMDVVIQLKRVLVKIDWVIELQWINKDRGYHYISMLMRKIKKGSVTVVQCAHGGDHGHRITIYSTCVNSLTEFLGSTENSHKI